MLNKATLAACPSGNGVVDDPGQCKFDPGTLLCKAGETGNSCLTEKEAGTVRSKYAGGFPPGNESVWTLWKMGPRERPVTGALSYVSNITTCATW